MKRIAVLCLFVGLVGAAKAKNCIVTVGGPYVEGKTRFVSISAQATCNGLERVKLDPIQKGTDSLVELTGQLDRISQKEKVKLISCQLREGEGLGQHICQLAD